MGLTELLFLLLALVSEVLGTVGGFGSSMFLVTLAAMLYPMRTVLGITAVLHVASNGSKLLLFRGQINRSLLIRIGGPAIVGVAIGAWLSTQGTWRWAELALGIFLILFSVILLLWPALRLTPSLGNALGAGASSGFLAGWLGTGGAIRGLALSAFQLDAGTFIATSAAIDLGVDATRAVIYLRDGYLQPRDWVLVPLALFAAVVGSWLGKLIVNRLSPEAFRLIVLWLILLIGVLGVVNWLRS